MSSMPAATLPQNTGSGYVAAAYIAFFAIVLIYVAIMAVRLSRVERDLRKLARGSQSHPEEVLPTDVSTPSSGRRTQLAGADQTLPRDQSEPVRERETV